MTRKSTLLMGIVAATALLMAARAPMAHASELRIATLAPDGSSWMKLLNAGAKAISKYTEGRVTHKFYPSGVQGDERSVVRKMKLGQLDGAALTSVGLALIEDSVRVLELPMMFKTTAELDYVRNKMWPYFQRKFAKKGFVLLAPGDVGFIYFYSSTPVKSISGLRNAKVWLWTDDRIVRAMFKKLGINGVPLGVPDVLPALQTGRINACYSSPLAAVALQWYTKVKYSTSMPMSYGIGATVIRQEAWNKLSAKDRTVITKIGNQVGKKLRGVVRKDNKRAFRAMSGSGVKVIETPASMVRNFDKAAQEVWKQLAGSVYSQKELDMVLKYRAEYRAKH
ncbi:MAG TPA: TRAP transporter substrate-binding protein DctP [Kofleriaceae bacterium]|nr:TRAP transporter substrate-binding protein DctP [Kofleriaceae bacterium]